MKTKVWKITDINDKINDLKEAADLLQKGELVAFPTETVYGLGANALDPEAVKKIFVAKGRPSDNPLIVHVSNEKQVENLVSEVSPLTKKLIEKFWPGPLTLVLKKSSLVPDIITAGLDTVAIRMPDHTVALKLIEMAQIPIAAPSANTSGKPSPTTAEHVYEDLNGKIAGLIDAGKTGVGVESTVLDLTTPVPTILRPGGVTKEDLLTVLEEVDYDTALKDIKAVPRSPGMKYTHYSPEADVLIITGDHSEIINKIRKLMKNNLDRKIGLMISKETYEILKGELPENLCIKILGKRKNLVEVTANLFAALRWFDKNKVEIIYAESFPETSLGVAFMNRLYKAAGGKVI